MNRIDCFADARNDTRKVLIISYLFPPIGGGGVIRVMKFVKYLPIFGWIPYVLTVKKGFYKIEDKSLLAEISKETEVIRVNYFEPAFWFKHRLWRSFLAYFLYPLFLIPDRQILWFLPAVIAARKIIKKDKIKIIFTTSAPASDHLIGFVLKKFTNVKWVVDFRDEWANNPLKKYPTFIHRWLNRFLEKMVVRNADKVITVSNPITAYLKSLSNNKEKFLTITNGFDEEDFEFTTKYEKLQKYKNKKFNIVHVGSLYNLKYQKSFVQAFQDLNLKNAYLTFVGTNNILPHEQAVREMIKADVLLVILDPIKRPAVLTGKLFEYLRAQKPILALAYNNSEVAKMIVKYQVGEVVEPSIEAFKNGVLKMYQKWSENDLIIPKIDIEKYERKNLTKKLVQLFDSFEHSRKIKLCLIGNIQSAQNQSLCHYFIKKNYDIYFISTKKGEIVGIKTYWLGENNFTPYYFLRSLRQIRKIIHKIQPNIVHGQDLVFAGIWAYLSGFRPFVVTPWGSDVMNYNKFVRPEKYLIRKTLQKADLVTVSSKALQDKAEEIGIQKNTVQIIHFGIDLGIFKKESNNRSKIIFCPRSIAPIYNTDILIHAFNLIAIKNQSVRLSLLDNCADENYLLEIEKIIIKYNLVDKIIFWPKVSNKKMADCYNQAEVVVSLSSSDGCSVSFLEAMACEKKIVATDLPYIKEWTKSDNLWRVPVRDIEMTAKAILNALNFPSSKWQRIGQANRQIVTDKAEINSNFDKLDRLYRQLL